MLRFIVFFGFLCFLFVACATVEGDDSNCDVKSQTATTNHTETVQVYKMIVHPSVTASKIGPIVEAAFEWTTATNGKFVFEVEYTDFNINTAPNFGEMRVRLAPNPDPNSNVIGTCAWWGPDAKGHPTKSQIWIRDDLDPRTHYLTTMHEVGHAIGLPHSADSESIMWPTLHASPDHPPCIDRKEVCKLWECDPGC